MNCFLFEGKAKETWLAQGKSTVFAKCKKCWMGLRTGWVTLRESPMLESMESQFSSICTFPWVSLQY